MESKLPTPMMPRGEGCQKRKLDNLTPCFFTKAMRRLGLGERRTFSELKILNQSRRKSVALELDQTVYVPTQDLFANVVKLSDLKGTLVESYRYTAFGEVEIFDGSGIPLDTIHQSLAIF